MIKRLIPLLALVSAIPALAMAKDDQQPSQSGLGRSGQPGGLGAASPAGASIGRHALVPR